MGRARLILAAAAVAWAANLGPPPGSFAACYDIFDNHWALSAPDGEGNRRLLVLPAQAPHKWVEDTDSHVPAGRWTGLRADELGYLWISGESGMLRMDPRHPERGWQRHSHISGPAAASEAWQKDWRDGPRLPGGNHDLSGDVLGDRFYMAGGQTAAWGYPARAHVFDQVMEFSAASESWRVACRLSRPRFYVATSILNGEVWVMGGNLREPDGTPRDVSTVEICNPEKGTVRRGPDLPVRMEMALAVHIEGRIYCTGAPRDTPESEPLRFYSIGSGESVWRVEPRGPAEGKALAGAAQEFNFYIVIPHRGLTAFDTRARLWRQIDSPEKPRSCQVAAHRGELWLMGGRDVSSGTGTWIYNPKSNRWRRGPDLPRELAWGAAASVGGKLIVAGGASGQWYSNRTFLLRSGGL